MCLFKKVCLKKEKPYYNRGDKMKRNNIIMALTLTSLALLFSETECGCHVMETIKEKM